VQGVLDNGLVVIVREDHASPVVSVRACVRVGGFHEGQTNAGSAHLLEHMLFKGTRRRGPGAIDREIEGLGGELNASTSKDFTELHVNIASLYFREAFLAVAEMVTSASLPAEEFDKERAVVLEEERMGRDEPGGELYLEFWSGFYGDHPYGKAIIGTPESLRSMSRDGLDRFYRRWYVPGNTVVVVAGDVFPAEVFDLAGRAFADFSGEAPPLPAPAAPKRKRERLEVRREAQQTLLLVGYPAPAADDPDTFVVDVILTAFGDGKSSRLYREIKEKRRLVDDIGCGYATQRGPGVFSIQAEVAPGRLEAAEEAILGEVARLRERGLTEEEIATARRKLEVDRIYSEETPASAAASIAYWAAVADLDFYLSYLERVRAVTVEDTVRVARRYLVDGEALVGSQVPATPRPPG
jgi:zinc protease